MKPVGNGVKLSQDVLDSSHVGKVPSPVPDFRNVLKETNFCSGRPNVDRRYKSDPLSDFGICMFVVKTFYGQDDSAATPIGCSATSKIQIIIVKFLQKTDGPVLLYGPSNCFWRRYLIKI